MLMRVLPLLLAVGLISLAASLWPLALAGRQQFLPWVNIALLTVLAIMAFVYGLRLWRQRGEPRPGSRLRAKLVMALVAMLLVPSMILQLTASQMVERGLDVWFDMRVDTLLDRALNLAQGFYARVEADIKQGMLAYMSDAALVQAVREPVDYAAVSQRLTEIRMQEGWQRLQLFDVNERLVAGVQESGLAALNAEPLQEKARLALALGGVVTDLRVVGGKEVAVGYAAVSGQQGIVGLLRADVAMPEGVVQNARAVESDYRSYRELERNRQSIRDMFTGALLLVTLMVVLVAGWVALIFARRLTAPIGQLAAALEQVTAGDLDVSIPSAPRDELGSLVQSFNRMAQRLKENVAALTQAQGELTQALASSRQRRQILETLLANLQTGVLLVDANGHIRLMNQSLKALLALPSGWAPGREIKRNCRGRLHSIGEFFDELCHQRQGQLQREIDLAVGKRTLHILARGARLSGLAKQGHAAYLIVIDDISFLAEAQRHRAWAEVARRLAHEIKNPLTPIKLAAERLQRRFRAEVSHGDVFDACTGTIIGQVERLQRLIGDFSTLARLPKPKLAAVDCRHVLAEMRELYSGYRQVQVEVPEVHMPCYCDADQVRQVLINLLDNAVAATRTGGTVRLFAEQQEEFTILHVVDDGEGISEENREHLFEPYFSTKEDGSGLGLAIARRIAEEHEGELLLLSPRQPTHFCLRLPVAAASMEVA